MTNCIQAVLAMQGAALPTLPGEVGAALAAQAGRAGTWSYLHGGEEARADGVTVLLRARIDNHAELAAAAGLAADCSPATLLARLFAKRGRSVVAELNGPFVAAIIQDNPRRVLLLRDQHGQNCLYYAQRADGLLFFSDSLAWLRSCPGLELGVDIQALSDYMSLGYVPAPRSIYAGIGKVPAGCSLSFSGSAAAVTERYWQPYASERHALSYEAALAETRQLLARSLERCLRAQPDAGILLSGGIDSSLLLGMTAPLRSDPIRSFTIGFEQERYDERALAALAATNAGAKHAARLLTAADLNLLPTLLAAAAEPFADSSLLPTALAMRFAAAGGCEAVLMGDGGDELFGGYQRYQVMAMRARLRWLPRGLQRALAKGLLACLPGHGEGRTALASLRRLAAAWSLEPLPCYASFQELFSPAMRAELAAAAELQTAPSYLDGWAEDIAASGLRDLVEQMNLLDLLYYLPENSCHKVALAAKGTGVQPLAPLLDVELTRFALSLPRPYRVSCRERKRLLRSLGVGIIPPRLLEERKRGFGVPLASWLRDEMAPAMRALVADHRQWDPEGYFDARVLARYVAEHLASRRDHSARLWALHCLQLWQQNRSG